MSNIILTQVPAQSTFKFYIIITIGVRGGGSGGGRRPPVLKNFRANSVFRAKASCSNILNDKKYIFNNVNSGRTLFSGQAQVDQTS